MHRQLNNSDQPASVASLAGSTASQASVEIKGVCKSYGEEWERQDVIKDLTLDILPGKLTVVVGPSGCGKSTLVNLIAGFERPDRGEILLNGRRVTGPSKDRMVVFQETALIPWQTTYQNVVFGPKLRGDIKGKALYQRAHELLTKVGLQDFMDKYPLQLSGGMQRRAELARALINQPQIMIMDEPFRGLDGMSRGLMQEFFLRLFAENRHTNLYVTSEIEGGIFLADRLLVVPHTHAPVRPVLHIHLPPPPHYQVLTPPVAFEYKRAAMEILHQEAMPSFRPSATGRLPGRP